MALWDSRGWYVTSRSGALYGVRLIQAAWILGKTVLASAIVEDAQKKQDVSVCFFFCRHGELAKSTFHSMARTFLLQLLRQNEDLLPYIYETQVKSFEVMLSGGTILEDLLCVGREVISCFLSITLQSSIFI